MSCVPMRPEDATRLRPAVEHQLMVESSCHMSFRDNNESHYMPEGFAQGSLSPSLCQGTPPHLVTFIIIII